MRPSPPPPASASGQRGAVLLILVAVLGLGAAALFVGALNRSGLEAARERRTIAILAQAKDALMGFAAVNGRLPRPAVSALDGRERQTLCGDAAACTGVLPWVALGVEPADSWGKLLRYSVTPAFTIAPIDTSVAVADKAVLGRDRGGALRYLAGQEDCSVARPCVPALLFSSGKNNLGVDASGVALPNRSASNADEVANQAATLRFMARVATADAAGAGGEFANIVSWIPLRPLYDQMRAAHNLP